MLVGNVHGKSPPQLDRVDRNQDAAANNHRRNQCPCLRLERPQRRADRPPAAIGALTDLVRVNPTTSHHASSTTQISTERVVWLFSVRPGSRHPRASCRITARPHAIVNDSPRSAGHPKITSISGRGEAGLLPDPFMDELSTRSETSQRSNSCIQSPHDRCSFLKSIESGSLIKLRKMQLRRKQHTPTAMMSWWITAFNLLRDRNGARGMEDRSMPLRPVWAPLTNTPATASLLTRSTC